MANSLKNVEDIIKLSNYPWKWGKEQGIMFPEDREQGYYTKNPLTDYVRRDSRIVYLVSTKPSQISLKIDNRTFLLDNRLLHIRDAINESKSLLELKEDWDEDGAVAIDPIIYYKAVETLTEYSINVFNVYNVAIDSPYISAGRDGSINMEWNKPNATLLLTILNSPNFNLHYYGDDGNNNTVIKGIINEPSINEDLSHWMRKL